VKIVIHGPLAGYGPDGNIASWGPDQEVDLDDNNPKAVAWGKAWLSFKQPDGAASADLVEDAKAEPSEPSLADLREQADAKGLPTYGTKAQLQERLAEADKGK
jgi:hypothetical protein